MEAITPTSPANDALHINSRTSSSPIDVSQCGDVDMWDDHDHKTLFADNIATPTGIEPFFDQSVMIATPSPIKRASYWNEETLHRFHQANQARLEQFHNQQHHEARVEPSSEPCTDEIPWPELVYWLGNSSTGQVECPCTTCQFERSQGRVPTSAVHQRQHQLAAMGQHYAAAPSSVYKRLSAKIPVIAVPRIEGVN